MILPPFQVLLYPIPSILLSLLITMTLWGRSIVGIFTTIIWARLPPPQLEMPYWQSTGAVYASVQKKQLTADIARELDLQMLKETAVAFPASTLALLNKLDLILKTRLI